MSAEELERTWENQDFVERRASRAPAAPAAPIAPTEEARRWERGYALTLVGVDFLVVTFAIVVGSQLRFRNEGIEAIAGGHSTGLVFLLAPLWVLLLAASRAYEGRFLGVGSDEFRRVLNASVRLTAVVALVLYSLQIDLARGFIAIALPLGTVLLLLGRFGARLVLREHRKRGQWTHRVLVVGARAEVYRLVEQMRREPEAGFVVVGACLPSQLQSFRSDDRLPVVGDFDDVVDAAMQAGADTVAIMATEDLGPAQLRQLSWDLEGTGVDLVVAPALTDVAGPRIHIRPVAGLPLLHVEEPEFRGVRRIGKRLVDLGLALGMLAFALVPMIIVAILIKIDSRGPVLFRQRRVGQYGVEFVCFKFRSMYVDAEERLATLETANESDGLLFKMKDDPRVTRVGRFIRRFSIDELPQLLNVLNGTMSTVGPRPPLPREVAKYGPDVRRRLLTRPGMTGLWQVSGRSDLSWEDTVRLDLSYVENWSLGMDLMILMRTFAAVVRGSGAY